VGHIQKTFDAESINLAASIAAGSIRMFVVDGVEVYTAGSLANSQGDVAPPCSVATAQTLPQGSPSDALAVRLPIAHRNSA
jgi:hypothetical protein